MTLKILLSVILLSLSGLITPAGAAVELARNGQSPVTLTEVYLRDGVPYLALEEVLAALALTGSWDSVQHVYRIESPRGTAIISPGSRTLRLGNSSQTMSAQPRFIDGRLRVPEEFVRTRIPSLLGEPIVYRNLDPPAPAPAEEETSPLDRLFAVLLRQSVPESGGSILRGVVIDPGHGGQDSGAFGPGGEKEKTIALDVGRRLEKLLKMRLGIPIHLTRDGDYSLDQQQRFELAARPDVDALILLHAQAAFGPAPHGVTLVVRPREETAGGSPVAGEGESMRLARHLGDALAQGGLRVAGITRAPLLPLGRGDLPTVLIELGYLSNPEDRALLRDPAGQERLAEALFTGLRNFAEDQKEKTTWSR